MCADEHREQKQAGRRFDRLSAVAALVALVLSLASMLYTCWSDRKDERDEARAELRRTVRELNVEPVGTASLGPRGAPRRVDSGIRATLGTGQLRVRAGGGSGVGRIAARAGQHRSGATGNATAPARTRRVETRSGDIEEDRSGASRRVSNDRHRRAVGWRLLGRTGHTRSVGQARGTGQTSSRGRAQLVRGAHSAGPHGDRLQGFRSGGNRTQKQPRHIFRMSPGTLSS